MILYLDTSAIVKLYISERYSELIHSKVDQSEVIATSIVAFPETISAIHRAHRNERLSDTDYDNLVDRVQVEWDRFLELQIDQNLKRHAGRIASDQSLRGFDSIHLASAVVLHQNVKSLIFACFDERLNEAARNNDINCIVD